MPNRYWRLPSTPNERALKPGDGENDRIGFLRKSLTHRERQKIKWKVDWYKTERGKAHVEIQRREENSTKNQEEWEKINLEEEAATHSTNLEASKT